MDESLRPVFSNPEDCGIACSDVDSLWPGSRRRKGAFVASARRLSERAVPIAGKSNNDG